MKKVFILYAIIFIDFCYAAQEKRSEIVSSGNAHNLKVFTSDDNSNFKDKIDAITQLEKLANPDIDLKYFKIKNKTNFDISIFLKKGKVGKIVKIPSHLFKFLGKYNQLELLSDADLFKVLRFNIELDSSDSDDYYAADYVGGSPVINIENNAVYIIRTQSGRFPNSSQRWIKFIVEKV